MARQHEISAGGIVYRKRFWKTEVLLLHWLNAKDKVECVIPKWKIEAWEVAKDTALREISEEAGLKSEDLEIIKFVSKLNYTYTAWYLEHAPIIEKDVYIFIVKYHGKDEPQVRTQERFVHYEWVDLEDIRNISMRFDLSGIIYRNKPYFT